MKFIKIASAVSLAGLLAIPSAAMATVITTHYAAEVTSRSGSTTAVGDTFTFTLTYDDASAASHWYNDEANGQADAGGVDDTVRATFNSNVNSFYADTTLGLSLNSSRTEAESDSVDFNWSTIYINQSTLDEDITITQDNFILQANSISDTGLIQWYFERTNGSIVTEEVRFNYEKVEVPAPASLALFAIGLVGLGFARRNTQA